MICPYSFDEPIGSGVPSLLDGRYWCMGWIALGMSARRRRCPEDCPVDFGPWGAWRAVVGQMVERMEWIDDCDEWQVAWAISTYLRQWIRSDLDAVGWSP